MLIQKLKIFAKFYNFRNQVRLTKHVTSTKEPPRALKAFPLVTSMEYVCATVLRQMTRSPKQYFGYFLRVC